MAPTGRSARVIHEKTGREAYTIHKTIYSFDDLVEIEEESSFYYSYKIGNSIDVVNKIFIVDEVSMISDSKSESEFFRFGSGHLLSDLISYTRVGHSNSHAKVIFVGDPCQLPPIGDNRSRALEFDYLKEKFCLTIVEAEITEIMRQQGESGILDAASKIRRSITQGLFNNFNLRANSKDIFKPSYNEFFDTWEAAKSPKIIIASKNKTCLDINLQLRQRIFGKANLPVQKGDLVIMGGNNYRKGIFNGEFAIVNEVSDKVIQRTVALRGKEPVNLYWRDLELIFQDADDEFKIISGKILENFLYGDNQLRPEERQALYVDFINRHKNLNHKTIEFKEAIIRDEYFNCLLIKFAYAVTGHKAQGGEWDNVFTIWDNDTIEGFNCFTDRQRNEGKNNENFFRWAYTAITRASKNLYTLNPPSFNSYSSMSFLDFLVLDALEKFIDKQAQPLVINLDQEIFAELQNLRLIDHPQQLQDHFIIVRHCLRQANIDVVGWERIGYEIRYTFIKENNRAIFKSFVNSKNEFKNSFSPIPNFSPNNQFNNAIAAIIGNLPKFAIKRDISESIIQKKIELEFHAEETFPFIRSLFDDLLFIFKDSEVVIEKVVHQHYRERYMFRRNSETATVDFEYNQNGFFGRVMPVKSLSNSQDLLNNIKSTLKLLKQD
jgi:hypothetical protein